MTRSSRSYCPRTTTSAYESSRLYPPPPLRKGQSRAYSIQTTVVGGPHLPALLSEPCLAPQAPHALLQQARELLGPAATDAVLLLVLHARNAVSPPRSTPRRSALDCIGLRLMACEAGLSNLELGAEDGVLVRRDDDLQQPTTHPPRHQSAPRTTPPSLQPPPTSLKVTFCEA